MQKFGEITFGLISGVKKSGDEDGVYFAQVQISPADGFPFEDCFYCARQDDYAATGKWVYQQIIDGNIVGVVTQLPANVDPMTGAPWPVLVEQTQPTTLGSQTL